MSSYTLDTSRIHRYRLSQSVALGTQKASEQISDKPGRITSILNFRRHTSSSTPILKLHDGILTGDDAVAYTDADDAEDTIAHIVQSALDGLAGFTNSSIPFDNLAITFPATLPADIEYLIIYEDNS